MRQESRGFTLIELLIVVAIIGILAAVGIPTLLNAVDRARQKRSMSDIRSIASAVESYSVDANFYPTGTNANDLALLLDGGYIKKMPRQDGWGFTFVYSRSTDGQTYTVGSTGKGGGATLTLSGGGGARNNLGDDIILSNGVFVQWPEGLQE